MGNTVLITTRSSLDLCLYIIKPTPFNLKE